MLMTKSIFWPNGTKMLLLKTTTQSKWTAFWWGDGHTRRYSAKIHVRRFDCKRNRISAVVHSYFTLCTFRWRRREVMQQDTGKSGIQTMTGHCMWWRSKDWDVPGSASLLNMSGEKDKTHNHIRKPSLRCSEINLNNVNSQIMQKKCWIPAAYLWLEQGLQHQRYHYKMTSFEKWLMFVYSCFTNMEYVSDKFLGV